MDRRGFLKRGFVFGNICWLAPYLAEADHADIVPLDLTEEQWRERLTPEQFKILREEGTEYPYSSALNSEKRRGLYLCAGCDLPLFESHAKYDSGTGWPSFFQSIPNHLNTKTDYRLIYPRTEYHCARCGGHQGHLFDDGPRPTGQRWCNNGLALKFIPEEKG